MNKKTLLTQTSATTFENAALKLLIAAHGENWKKKFTKAKEAKKSGKTEKIIFDLPVLADVLIHDLWSDDGMPKMQKSKLANMILKKIHDKNTHHVLTLLKTFLTDIEISQKWEMNKSHVSKEVAGNFEKLLVAAWFNIPPNIAFGWNYFF